ncbi:MAG: arsC 2 [Verrucomicrobiaceae bacterium]|nr:arsC 2 [Verrucomicrobiaceae bacterium]
MSDFSIYHNPRCSKSRQTLLLLEQHGITPEIVLYLEQPPSKNQLKTLLRKLGLSARELLRSGEDEYRTLNLGDQSLSEDALLDAMHTHPKLIERPIVVHGERAIIGRPPESILELIA